MSDYSDALAALQDNYILKIEESKRLALVKSALKIKQTPEMLEALEVIKIKRDVRVKEIGVALEALKIVETKIASSKKKRIILKKPDGSCKILTPGKRAKLTIEEIAEKDTPIDSEPIIIEDLTIIPTDTTFQEAWIYDSSTSLIDVDMPKARIVQAGRIDELKKKKRREHLESFLGALLDEDTEKENSIKAQNKEIKKLPRSDFSEISTPEKLKAAIPKQLL